MSVNNSKSNGVALHEIKTIEQVGGVRAFRLERDCGFTKVREVSYASLEELQSVTSIGPVRAKQIKGSAQGIMKQYRAANEVGSTQNVAMVAGDGVLDDVGDSVAKPEVVEGAIEASSVSLDGNVRVGTVAPNGKDSSMGGDEIHTFVSMKQSFGCKVMTRIFETPWSKYSRILDPIRHVDDEWLEAHDITHERELPAGRMPDRPAMKDIPFDIARYSEVHWGHAPMERTANMVEWADKVVILVDGQYADRYRQSCEYNNVDCETIYELQTVVSEDEERTEEEGETIYEKKTVPVFWEGDDEPDMSGFEPAEKEAVRGEGGVREGSVPDLANDDHFRDEPNDLSENRVENDPDDLTKADAGGTGVGSMSQRWG